MHRAFSRPPLREAPSLPPSLPASLPPGLPPSRPACLPACLPASLPPLQVCNFYPPLPFPPERGAPSLPSSLSHAGSRRLAGGRGLGESGGGRGLGAEGEGGRGGEPGAEVVPGDAAVGVAVEARAQLAEFARGGGPRGAVAPRGGHISQQVP